jgi:RNA polymerase sigma-70 factor (ECF subfamily)
MRAYGQRDHDPHAHARASMSSMNREPSTGGAVAVNPDDRARSSVALGLETFVAEHYDRLLRLAWLVCRDGSDAGDAVQAGLEAAWKHQAMLRDQASLKSWLDRIVVREAGRIAKRRRGLLARVLSPRSEVAWIEQADERIGDGDDRMAVRAAFDRLSPEHRAVVALHLYEGYSVAETADLVGAPIETVRSRLRVAKEHLRAELQGAVR